MKEGNWEMRYGKEERVGKKKRGESREEEELRE